MQDFEEPRSLGWDAIDNALRPIYGDTEPLHWGTIVSWEMGGPDPIRGISAYRRYEPEPHLHYVTFGFSELYEKESDNPAVSGWGFELTFRLAQDPQTDPPNWVLSFLQNLGRYVFETGRVFGDGHHMTLNGPIALGSDTEIRFEPGESLQWRPMEQGLVLQLTAAQTDVLVRMLRPSESTNTASELSGLTVVIEKTIIRDSDGNVVETIG